MLLLIRGVVVAGFADRTAVGRIIDAGLANRAGGGPIIVVT